MRVGCVTTVAAGLLIASGGQAGASGFAAPEPDLDVVAVAVGGTTYAAAVGATPGHVCRSAPEGPPIGATDEYGQAIVNTVGIAAVQLPGSRADRVMIACGPQHGGFTHRGTANVVVGS